MRKCEDAERDVRMYLKRLGLELHPDKTRRVELYDGKQGFDFLGCHFRKRLSGAILEREGKRKYFLHRQPSQRAMKRIRQKVRDKTSRGRCHADLRAVIADLNPVLEDGVRISAPGTPREASTRSMTTYADGWSGCVSNAQAVSSMRASRRGGLASTSRASDSIACAAPSSIRRLPSTAGTRALPQAVCGVQPVTTSSKRVEDPPQPLPGLAA